MPNKQNIIKKVVISCLFIITSFMVSCSNSTEDSTMELESVLEQDIETKHSDAETKDSDAETKDSETSDSKMQKIYVFVCGAVKQEGVYELPSGSRVYEAIQKAGGFQEDAATEYINQAEILQDEMQIYVPTQKELESGELTQLQKNLQYGNQSQGTGKININTATTEELMTLPGVGEEKANSIIQYRETNGKFKQIEDIMLISGIKEGLFEKIKNSITI